MPEKGSKYRLCEWSKLFLYSPCFSSIGISTQQWKNSSGWHFSLFPARWKTALPLSSWVVRAPHSLPRKEGQGRVGWEVQIIPIKGWGKCLFGHRVAGEPLDEQLFGSAGALQEFLQKCGHPSLLQAVTKKHGFPGNTGWNPLVTAVNGSFGSVSNGSVLSQQKAVVYYDASHETPSLVNGGRQELPQSD